MIVEGGLRAIAGRLKDAIVAVEGPVVTPTETQGQTWYCVQSPQAHLRMLEPVIRVEVAQPFVDPPDLTWLYPNRPPTSTAAFRVDCVQPMKVLNFVQSGGPPASHTEVSQRSVSSTDPFG